MRKTGMINWIDPHGRVGSIRLDEGGDGVLVPSTARRPDGSLLEEGQRVSFDVVDGPRGPEATNILPIEE